MKVAVLADIHANWVGLQTVAAHIEAWQPDRVIVGGDVVNRGPLPRECLQFVLEKQRTEGWLTVRGNHEDYVLIFAKPEAPRHGPLYEIYQNADWTLRQLDGDATALRAMPFQQSLVGPEGGEVRIVHASMLNTRNGIFVWTTDEELRHKIAPPPQVICVGHTHWPLIRHIDETLIINVGSAGLPFDGDDRLSYAQLIWQRGAWQAEIIRLPYDKARNEQDFYDSGFMRHSGGLAPLVLDELHAARPRLYRWTMAYEKAVLDGEISLTESVQRFLQDLEQ